MADLSYLFVYGTLRPRFHKNKLQQFVKGFSFIGEGSVEGLLYEIEGYPALKIDEGCGERVWGDVIGLGDVENDLPLLDHYEECDGYFEKPHEYRRIGADVALTAGSVLRCWVYDYVWDVSESNRIEKGDYLGFLHERSLGFH